MSFLSKIKSWLTLKDTSVIFPEGTNLIELEGFLPDNFKYGIEILNDNTTPMEFVVNTLETNLLIKKDEAISLMLEIHTKGGVVIPLNTMEHALEVAQSIKNDAEENNYVLACRAINA